ADLASSSLQGIDSPWPAFLASSLAADTLVPSDDPTIQAAALAIQKKEKNPFRQIVLASQWVSSNVKLNDKSQGLSDEALVALKHKAGGTRALALLNCAILRALGIPAVPVAGFLATGDNRLIPHFWGEYYLTGMGWIPFDPLLASGYVPQQFSGGFSDRLIYYRGIDNRHIAMSRGYRLLPAVSREVQKKQKVSWSFFEYDELSLGLSYSSTWDIAMISWNANP
ncbi:MAG: transglutaminase-like domain-containing protein, partial [Spirochaetota bacterium]